VWGIFRFLHDRFRHDNPDRQILYPRVGGEGDAEGISNDGGYFEIWASRMFLRRDRNWFHGQYPTVQSFFTFDFGSGGGSPIDIAHAAGPSRLGEVGEGHLGNVIQMNHLLCGPVPFRSGSVQMQIALIATREDDDIKRLLDVVGDFSTLVAVPQLSTALDVARKVTGGVEKLANADGNTLVTGFEGTFVGSDGDGRDSPSGHSLRDSFFLAVNAPVRNFDEKDLRFVGGRVLYQNEPLVGVDWMLVELRTYKHLSDPVGSLSSIEEPLNDAIKALGNVQKGGDTTAADLLYHGALAAALTSSDLIQADKEIAAAEVSRRYEKAKIDFGLKETPSVPTGDGGPEETLESELLTAAKEKTSPIVEALDAIEPNTLRYWASV
jgi:hypothetical protein